MPRFSKDGFTGDTISLYEQEQTIKAKLKAMDADHARQVYIEETVYLPLYASVVFGLIYAVADLYTTASFPAFF